MGVHFCKTILKTLCVMKDLGAVGREDRSEERLRDLVLRVVEEPLYAHDGDASVLMPGRVSTDSRTRSGRNRTR